MSKYKWETPFDLAVPVFESKEEEDRFFHGFWENIKSDIEKVNIARRESTKRAYESRTKY